LSVHGCRAKPRLNGGVKEEKYIDAVWAVPARPLDGINFHTIWYPWVPRGGHLKYTSLPGNAILARLRNIKHHYSDQIPSPSFLLPGSQFLPGQTLWRNKARILLVLAECHEQISEKSSGLEFMRSFMKLTSTLLWTGASVEIAEILRLQTLTLSQGERRTRAGGLVSARGTLTRTRRTHRPPSPSSAVSRLAPCSPSWPRAALCGGSPSAVEGVGGGGRT
jgi:hypothetical protein